jgi:excisionase family DNA binding protein
MTNTDMPALAGKLMYSVKELAGVTGLSAQAIRNEIKAHKLVAISYGTKYLIEPTEAEAWIARLRSERAA